MKQEILDRFYREMIDAVDTGLIVVDRGGTIRIANAHMEVLTGFSPGELEGASCAILNCDACQNVRSKSKDNWCRLFEVGKVRGKRCTMMQKNGIYVSVIKKASLLKDDRGEIIGALETFTDITDLDRKDLEIRQLSRLLAGDGYCGMIGQSAAMAQVCQMIETASAGDAPVIIHGERGTGKKLAAHAIHRLGRRKQGPLIRFDCATLKGPMQEGELFGHTRGGLPGIRQHRRGRIEVAHGGDLFLDEIDELAPSAQARLLRVVEAGQFERVGDTVAVSVDVRLMAATSANMSTLIAQGAFRRELHLALSVLTIHLPPLRERKEDIPLLAEAFIGQLRQKSEKSVSGLHPDALQCFMAYDWPGNVGELKSALTYAFAAAESGTIEFDHLPASIQSTQGIITATREATPPCQAPSECDEKTALIQALKATGGNKSAAAKLLGVNRMTVWNRMRKYGLHLETRIKI